MNLFQKGHEAAESQSNSPVEGEGYLIQNILGPGGTDSSWVCVAHENGELYSLPNAPRSGIARDAREAAVSGMQLAVSIGRDGNVRYNAAGEDVVIGTVGDYRGKPYEVVSTRRNRITGKAQETPFHSITLVRVTATGDISLNENGRTLMRLIVGAAGDDEAMSAIVDFLTAAYPQDFNGDPAEGELEPCSPVGEFVYGEIESVLSVPSETGEDEGSDDTEPVEGTEAAALASEAGDPAAAHVAELVVEGEDSDDHLIVG